MGFKISQVYEKVDKYSSLMLFELFFGNKTSALISRFNIQFRGDKRNFIIIQKVWFIQTLKLLRIESFQQLRIRLNCWIFLREFLLVIFRCIFPTVTMDSFITFQRIFRIRFFKWWVTLIFLLENTQVNGQIALKFLKLIVSNWVIIFLQAIWKILFLLFKKIHLTLNFQEKEVQQTMSYTQKW